MVRDLPEKVSIVIVSWNQEEYTLACLESVYGSILKDYQVILVDNGSSDNTVQNVRKRFNNVKIIQNSTNLGYAIASNQGVKVTKGEYVILLNNDTTVKPDTFRKLLDFMQKNKKVGVAQAKLYWMSDKTRNDLVGTFLTPTGLVYYFGYGKKDDQRYKKIRSIFFAKGAAMIIRKEVFNKIGYLDEDYITYFEEYDFCWRVWLAGWRIAYVPESVVYHYLNISGRRLKKPYTFYLTNRNRIMTLVKNLEFKNILWILPLHLLVITASAFFYLFKNKNLTKAILRAILWNIINVKKLLKKRKNVKSMRQVSDSEIFEYNMVSPPFSYYLHLTKDMKDFKDIEVPNYYE